MCIYICVYWHWHWSRSVVSDSLWPHGLFLRPCNFPGKSTEVGWHFFLQEIFRTQGLNLGLPHCRQTLYRLSHQGSLMCIWVSILQSVYLFFGGGGGAGLCGTQDLSFPTRDWTHTPGSGSREVSVSISVLLKIILFIFGCACLCCSAWAFSSFGKWELLPSCSAPASHCSGFSCCGAQVLGFSTCGAWA